MNVRVIFFTIALSLCGTSLSAQETLVGGLIGMNVNQLTQPTDPAGEPTLLFGSAFSGIGFSAGGTFTYDLIKLGPGYLTGRGDLMLGFHRAKGFAEHRVDDFRREVVLSTLSLRVPALFGYAIVEGPSRIYTALGPELLLNFATGSSVTQENVDVLPRTLDTKGATHIALSAALGFGYSTGGWQLPIELRFAWDPFVGQSTRDRFPDFRSNEDPGPYQVAYDWQAFVTVGAIKILSSGEKP